ncbi:hypothetical protein [Pseudanabaena sp. PCC 6802]|uniref:hypothetical protein n=1 Tax=Pseudanabaena sp. PCC 6802 TaxID=118173 RepID=UPI0003496886|nr:hypothetical protein [Pseudanabaena sp. PCC 6802]
MTISNYDQLVAALPTAQLGLLSKTGPSTQLAGALSSLWLSAGFPAAGSAPGVWATCTDATAGGWPFANPTAPALSYLSNFNCAGSASHYLTLYDRLGHMGGLSGTVAGSAQAINGVIPANRGAAVDGSDVEWFFEIYTAIGTTAANATVAYTDQNDVARNAPAIVMGGASPANQPSRLFRIIPNAGQPIKTVTNVTLSGSTGTAGNFGVTCARRILTAAMGQVNIGANLDFAGTGLPRIYDDACLWFAALLSNATSGTFTGSWNLVQG